MPSMDPPFSICVWDKCLPAVLPTSCAPLVLATCYTLSCTIPPRITAPVPDFCPEKAFPHPLSKPIKGCWSLIQETTAYPLTHKHRAAVRSRYIYVYMPEARPSMSFYCERHQPVRPDITFLMRQRHVHRGQYGSTRVKVVEGSGHQLRDWHTVSWHQCKLQLPAVA